MKRLFLSLFTLVFAIYSFSSTRDYYIPIGESCSIVGGSVSSYYCSYTVSDENIIAVSYSSSGNHRFEVTGLRRGTSTLTYTLREKKSGSSYNNTYVCIIHVVDVVDISMVNSLDLSLGDSYNFNPVIIDAGATTTLSWHSSNTSVATIDSEGHLTTVGLGTTTITCTAANGISTQCEVTISPKIINSIALNRYDKELIIGEQLQLQAIVLPDNATDKSLRWSSSNESVAVVNESGLVTTVGAGLCNITAATKDGSELTASCLVTVLGNVMFCEGLGAVPGATVTLPIQLANEDAIQGFEFELVLPDGVRVETNSDGMLAATLTERFSTTGLDGALLENGNYKFVFTSTSRILGKEGAVVNVPLVVADDAVIGTYDITIKNVELVKYGTSSQIHHGDRTAMLTIKEMTLGDVNGDGRVSVADAISIINYVLGRNPVSFITKAADVNGDESISLADAVAVVDIILGRSSGNVKAFIQELITLDPQ